MSAVATTWQRLCTGVLCSLLAGVASSCGNDIPANTVAGPVTQTTAGPAAQIVKTAGDSQIVSPGKAVPVLPTVRVTDGSGNGVAGVRVLFTVGGGGGSVTGGDVITDAQGLATVGGWSLGTTKGTNLLTASVGEEIVTTFTVTAAESSPDITLFVRTPQADSLVGDALHIVARVQSHYELASVRATVGTTQVALSYVTVRNQWEGVISLQGMPRDTLQLVVTARDVTGSASDRFVVFVHDRAPTLTVTGPDNGVVARPSIDLAADCTDDDPAGCRSLVVAAQYPYTYVPPDRALLTGQSHIGGSVSLADFDGQVVTLFFTATDSRGQVVQATRMVYVESSTKLSQLVTVNGVALDLRGDHLLYRGTDEEIALRNIASGMTQAIYADTTTASHEAYGFVTSVGAIIAVGTSSVPYVRLLDWRNGTLVDLGGLNGGHSLVVNGDYAIFSNGGTLTRRDLAAGTNTIISHSAGNTDNGVARNGDVAFWSGLRIYLYHEGTTTLITSPTGLAAWYPLTDGVHVVYRQAEPCCSPGGNAIMFHDDTGETVLGRDLQSLDVTPYVNYAVNGGWTAFTSHGVGGVIQVWTRSPAGELRQVSKLGTHSRISALGSDGTVIFESVGRRYLAAPDGTPEDLMSSLGSVLWRDGKFVALIGGTAFSIMP